MKTLALALIVIGLLLGPAYWIYSRFFTGNETALIDLKAEAGPDGAPAVWRSTAFRLDTGMAPIGLILLAQGHFKPNTDENKAPKDPYHVILERDGQAAEPLTISLNAGNYANSSPAFREHLVLMQKVQSGEYHVVVKPVVEPTIQIDRMQLQVRDHLREPDPNVVMGGIIAFVLGILVLVMG